MSYRFLANLFFIAILIASCGQADQTGSQAEPSATTSKKTWDEGPLFKSLPHTETGVEFNNLIDVNKVKSPLEYVNVYNGGGVAAGDINNDGLADIYFTGNMAENRLYLNKGNFKFEDITDKAGIACKGSWSTGVTMADVNGDGWLDIYVCRAYFEQPMKRQNQLFINNGDLTFSEKSKEYGVGDTGYSIVSTFFDYDKDGDPDLYVSNHPLNRTKETYGYHLEKWHNPPMETSDHFYRNNGDGTFTNVTKEAGILNYTWTLGAVVADLNQDGWPDLYLTVDHAEPDRYYQNQGDGTFKEVSAEKMRHFSFSSMGVDAGDINNDGLLDLGVVEMLSTNNFNEKTKMAPMNPKRFWYMVENGYGFQYMRNMLHLNMGNGEFSEIGQMAGVNRSNWSWASLLADFDNDGWKDLFVTNGYLREYLDKDHHIKFEKAINEASANGVSQKPLIKDYGRSAPVNQVPNDFFHNNGDLTFTEMAPEFGLDNTSFSSGAAYADFDNDGDLDLVVNHSNDFASVYQNQDRERGGNNYLRFKLDHPNNLCPVGTKVTLESASGMQFQEFTYTRGYQSSVEGVVHFGLAKDAKADKVTVRWPDGKEQVLTGVDANQVVELKYADAGAAAPQPPAPQPLFVNVTKDMGLAYRHREMPFDDYKKQVLLPHKMSQLGPFMSSADVNRDGLEDFFVGGGNGQPGALFLQTAEGQFAKADIPTFNNDFEKEDMGSAFFDANNDGLMDLYVASGGNEFDDGGDMLQDRLYINVGKGLLRKVHQVIPEIHTSSSCVRPFDFDGDGDMDLFIGGRQVPGKYPFPASSYLLINEKGFFKDATAELAPQLNNLGMVTDAVWTDFDGDGTIDLLIVGEWMPVTVFTQKDGKFTNTTESFGLENTNGWWNRIAQGDLDNDGDMDFVLGNLGWNYKYRATEEKPFHVYAGDFDGNGTSDIALGYFLQDDKLYPVRGRQCSSEQIPEIAEKFPTYNDYGKASIFEVYGDKLESALHYQVRHFSSSVLKNMGNGVYQLNDLPSAAQIAPANGVVLEDLDKDGNLDLVIGGNLFVSEVETGRADAGKGMYLKGQGDGTFKPFFPYESGLNIPGDVKDILPLKTGVPGERIFIVGSNNANLEVWKWNGGAGRELSSLK